jgi:hypothetical protein
MIGALLPNMKSIGGDFGKLYSQKDRTQDEEPYSGPGPFWNAPAGNPYAALMRRPQAYGGGGGGMGSLASQLSELNLGGPDDDMEFNPYWQLMGRAPYSYTGMGGNYGQADLGSLFGQPTPRSSQYFAYGLPRSKYMQDV